MTKSEFENKSLVFIVLIGYILNFICTSIGYLFNVASSNELLHYEIANAFAISASVMAGRYTGLRGQHVAASAYILLGIAHGISLASLSRAGINADRGAMMAIPMIPSFIFMFWCSLYPLWLRVIGLIPIALFSLVFVNVQSGQAYFGMVLTSGYAMLQMIEVIWGIYLYKDWKQNRP
ncbi:MAG: hypothetical protein JNM22_15270 [Saprospiraceae bacterium]|nr:hypothetical protein [Saprospiraceae bacterium]